MPLEARQKKLEKRIKMAPNLLTPDLWTPSLAPALGNNNNRRGDVLEVLILLITFLQQNWRFWHQFSFYHAPLGAFYPYTPIIVHRSLSSLTDNPESFPVILSLITTISPIAPRYLAIRLCTIQVSRLRLLTHLQGRKSTTTFSVYSYQSHNSALAAFCQRCTSCISCPFAAYQELHPLHLRLTSP